MDKEKYTIEYNLSTVSTNLLWSYVSTPVGLSTWFADDVTADGRSFTFYWAKEGHKAEQIGTRAGSCIRFHWCDDTNPKSYFELRIIYNELVNDVILEVTDFAGEADMKDSKNLWNEQITALRKRLGAKNK